MTTETLTKNIWLAVYEEVQAEFPLVRENVVAGIAQRVCDKVQPAINDYDPIAEMEQALKEASEKLGW